MRPTIFARMVIGYLAIFIPMAAVGAYTILEIASFYRVASYILHIDNRMKNGEKELTDSILSQVRYERKYVIAKDEGLYNQFVLAGREVTKYIDEAMSIADTPSKKETLIRVRDYYERYKSVFHSEVEIIKKKEAYFQQEYQWGKEQALDQIMEELRNLRLQTEISTDEKMKYLAETEGKASKIAIAMGLGFIFSGIIILIFITKTITGPLSFVGEKTRQVASGDFQSTLDLTSPPEIGDLAQDFNLMCDKLREMDRMKSEFFSLMAHELRTPLASIKEGISLLLEGIDEELKEKRSKILIIIAEESNRLIDLVNSLLDLSKMEAGMMTFDFAPSDIRPLIRKTVSGMEPMVMARNVHIVVEMPQDLPHVNMDVERILQALRNLIGNAVKFTPNGGQVAISVKSIEEGVSVSVADTGPGIPEEDLNAIFDKFKQATIRGYRDIKGTGLGLAIVKYIVDAHGGRVWVESKLGHGSVFAFVLPS